MRMRKKKHGFDRITALSSIIIQNKEKLNINPNKPFLSDRPIRLEIGCGKGDFIIRTSEREAEYNYYALEKISDVLVIAAEKYAEIRGLGAKDRSGRFVLSGEYADSGDGKSFSVPPEKCGNVRFINGDAGCIGDYFPENTFSDIYLNFSDPWHKKGYAKRRLTHIDFLGKYSVLLERGGSLRFKTDNLALFEFSLEQIEKSPFSVVWETRDLHRSDKARENIMTEYERYFSDQGVKINSLVAVNMK